MPGSLVYTITMNDPQTPGKVVLARSGSEARELARFPVPGLLEYASLTLVNGKLFIRLHERAACYDLRAADSARKQP